MEEMQTDPTSDPPYYSPISRTNSEVSAISNSSVPSEADENTSSQLEQARWQGSNRRWSGKWQLKVPEGFLCCDTNTSWDKIGTDVHEGKSPPLETYKEGWCPPCTSDCCFMSLFSDMIQKILTVQFYNILSTYNAMIIIILYTFLNLDNLN